MRLGLGSSLAAVLLASFIAVSYTEAVHTAPVNLHAANAAEAADVAEQAAVVAKRVAYHTEEVAHDTAAALRYTQDALRGANADANDVAEVGKQASKLEEEAGISSGDRRGSSRIEQKGSSISRGSSGSSSGSSNGSRSGGHYRSRSGGNGGGNSDGNGGGNGGGNSGGNGGGNSGGNGGSNDEGGNSGSSSGGSNGGSGGRGLDVNSEIVPYPGGAEPFGQEEPAKEMTKESVKQSDGMVDTIENAQGVEAKRSVYRALTKLRGATIASYDGMAKGHLKNVDAYNKKHSWRSEHPFRHLAEEESDTHIWAFPKTGSSKATKSMKADKAPAGIKPASPAPAPAEKK